MFGAMIASGAVPAARASGGARDTLGWPTWCAVASSLTVAFGVHWDIAWHRSIGRDAFWSPPHVAIYAAAVLAATAALARIVPATFGGRRAFDGGAHVLGFRGPLGAFISSWGGAAMIASAPFDDWWHNAYGLDVKILSPPHVVLAIGILCLHLGALVMLAGAMNRADGDARRRLESLVVAIGGMVLVAVFTIFMEKTVRDEMHRGSFYLIVALFAPFVLAAMARATGRRWAGTQAAGVYSVFLLALLWGFPLVPAEPKLGPVLSPVDCLIPPEFPLLLLPAAAVLDAWLWRGRGRSRPVAAGGVLFVSVFFVLQWPFASFLMSPHARNYFWGAKYFDFSMPSWWYYRRYAFMPEDGTRRIVEMVLAWAASMGSALCGWSAGGWLGRVRR